MTSASMATEKSVIECFTESSCPILREDDIMSRCKEIDAAKLQECLLRMTRRGDLGSRTIVNNQSEVAIYWLSHGGRNHVTGIICFHDSALILFHRPPCIDSSQACV